MAQQTSRSINGIKTRSYKKQLREVGISADAIGASLWIAPQITKLPMRITCIVNI
jgi:hypothetical protein